jgi:hypothetical protein
LGARFGRFGKGKEGIWGDIAVKYFQSAIIFMMMRKEVIERISRIPTIKAISTLRI